MKETKNWKAKRMAHWDYTIDPTHRAWFITANGKLFGGATTHQSLLKTSFPEEWEKWKKEGEEDWKIAEVFEMRLLKAGGIKIGEYEGFNVEVRSLDKEVKDMLGDFTEALLRVRPSEKTSIMRIEETFINKAHRYSLEQIIKKFYEEINE